MSGVRGSIAIDDDGLERGMRQLAEFGADPSEALQEIGDMAVTHIERRFHDEAGPGGIPWLPSIRVQRGGGGKTLTLTTRLATSFEVLLERLSVAWGTNLIYAGVHQAGATIAAKNKPALTFNIPGVGWISKKSVTIPARPFVGWDESDQRAAQDILVDHMTRALEGGGTA